VSAWPEWPSFTATAGTLTQLEMFQKPLKVVGRTLGHTRLGVFCWLEVIDFDPFLGFLSLALHVCYFSFAEFFISCVSVRVQELTMFGAKTVNNLTNRFEPRAVDFG
jgi:hypothetical protein